MKYLTLLVVAVTVSLAQQLNPQSMAINTDGSTANASALLDVKSCTKGILIPRLHRGSNHKE